MEAYTVDLILISKFNILKMKFAIVALVVALSMTQSADAFWGYGYGGLYGGYGYGFWGKRDVAPPTSILNRTECVYNQDEDLLSCHGASGVVECKTEMINAHPIEFSVFGLGLLEESENEAIKYNIIPRKVDNSGR